MYHATRKFIQARQIHCQWTLEVRVVKNIGGGAPNQCIQNSYKTLRTQRKATFVSGWVVSKFDPKKPETEFTAHFWNALEDGSMIDTTPLGIGEFEYVEDADLNDFGQKYIDELDSTLCSSLLLKDDLFYVVERMQYMPLSYRRIDMLSNEELFKAHFKKRN